MNVFELGNKRAKELGLQPKSVDIPIGHWSNAVYLADDIHKLLGESMEVFGGKVGLLDLRFRFEEARKLDGSPNEWATHTAFLIGIKPIEKDSAEELLQDFLKWFGDNNIIQYRGNKLPDCNDLHSLEARAKKLLENK